MGHCSAALRCVEGWLSLHLPCRLTFTYPHVVCRFSRTLPFFSHATVHQTSPRSSLPWITSTRSWQLVLSTPSTLSRSKQRWPWAKKHLIDTTARLTILKFTGSL